MMPFWSQLSGSFESKTTSQCVSKGLKLCSLHKNLNRCSPKRFLRLTPGLVYTNLLSVVPNFKLKRF
jgi:hypothetical protein